MKQQRTVKSLLPRKYTFGGKFLTTLLLVLSVVLCLGAASLMTITSVSAEQNEEHFPNIYSGYDDRVEVLYRLEFGDPENLWGDDSVDEFYMKDGSLYVTPNRIVVKGSTGSSDETHNSYLGGSKNTVKSDNITMIAGYKNTIENNNDNSSVLGGSGNKVKGTSSGAPAVLAGGKGNVIDENNGDAILGGSGNKIIPVSNKKSSNSVILGGEGNEIRNGKNVIVGGRRVNVDGRNNIFAFSNSDATFSPKFDNAFYLNLKRGVGINADSEKTGMAVGGAVGFGEININTFCNGDNLGVEGTWYVDNDVRGCLVGCTVTSFGSGGKWELLDRGSFCEEKCKNNNKCMVGSNSSLEEGEIYGGFCSTMPNHSVACTTGQWETYGNVVFQTVLLNNKFDCDKVGDNKCVFYCEDGYKKGEEACILSQS